MKHKPAQRALIILLILMLTLPQLTRADMTDPGGNVTLSEGDFSAVGGLSSADGVSMMSASRPPSHLTSADYQAIHGQARPLLDRGVDFRTNEISIVPADTLEHALQNYADFNDGELFYDFCADYDQIDERGYCPEPSYPITRTVRNDLIDALELYATLLVAPTHVTMAVDGQELPVREVGRTGVLSATREIANVHLIFGNEFLIDASDYRFSTGGIPNADEIIGRELEELEMALQQFELATDILSYAFNTPLGGPVHDFLLDNRHIGDYFTSREFELFGVASNRLMTTLAEMATRYHVLGDREKALAIYDQAYVTQYMQTMALAQKANELDADYLQNGSWEMLNNLSQLRERAQAIRDGVDPFGFAPDYVPVQPYGDLLVLAEDLYDTADEFEEEARDAQRQFDEDGTALTTELSNLQQEYDDALFDLCGTSTDDYATCEGGLMAQNLSDMKAGSLRVGLAWQRAENIAEQIAIEEERAGQVINVTLDLGQTISAAELAIGKLEAERTTTTKSSASEHEVHEGVDLNVRVFTGVEGTVSLNPFRWGADWKSGWEFALETNVGYQHSNTWTDSTETVWDPTAEAIAGYSSIQALKEAEANAQIEGANSAAVIKNLLLQQSELLLEYEIAMEEWNKLAAEQNHLGSTWSRLLNQRAQASEQVMHANGFRTNPAYRIMRDTLTVQAAKAHAQAAQFAYLAARAAAYDMVTPYEYIGLIYKARTSADIRQFLDGLKIWYQAPTVVNNRYPYTISIAQDILGLTDQNLDPVGTMTPEQRAQLRYERFQEFLQGHRFADGTLEFQFATSLDQRRSATQYLFSPNLWGNRIAGIGSPLPGNQGVSINILTRQTTDVGRPEVKLIHGGQASYRDPEGKVVHYDPGPAVPVGYVIPVGLAPPNLAIVLVPGINGEDITGYDGLENLSVATSSWTVRIPYASSGNLDLYQIEDIEIGLDSTGRAIQRRELQAERDALRLQAGLELEPVIEDETVPAAISLDTQRVSSITPRVPPAVSLANAGGVTGTYFGSVVITSPLPVAVQLLTLDISDLGGTLSGTVYPTHTALYSGTMALHGSTDGHTFELASDVITTVVSGREVRQSFELEGQVVEGGDILRGVYTGTISGFIAEPIIVEGNFSGSRLVPPGGKLDALIVEVDSESVVCECSTAVTATLFEQGEPVTRTTRITFTAAGGVVTPPAVDTVDGVATATFTAGDTPGPATVVATTGWLTGTTWIDVVVEPKVYLPLVLRN
jgi:hypothetical protein